MEQETLAEALRRYSIGIHDDAAIVMRPAADRLEELEERLDNAESYAMDRDTLT